MNVVKRLLVYRIDEGERREEGEVAKAKVKTKE